MYGLAFLPATITGSFIRFPKPPCFKSEVNKTIYHNAKYISAFIYIEIFFFLLCIYCIILFTATLIVLFISQGPLSITN